MFNASNTDRFNRLKKTSTIHYNMEVNKVLSEIIDDFPDQLKGMEYFYNKFRPVEEGKSLYPKDNMVASIPLQH